MPTFEEALARLEREISDVEKAAKAFSSSLRKLGSAARSGNVAEIRKSLINIPIAATAAGEAVAKIDGAWSFDLSTYMSGEEYNQELIAAAEAAGITLKEKDGRLYCFPLLMRPLPRDGTVKIGKRTERGLRPKELVKKLAALQKRPQRFSEQRFLDLLYKAYLRVAGSEWRTEAAGRGRVVFLADLHDLLTLLPGSDYPIEEFGRDLLLLARKPDLAAAGCRFDFSDATLGREPGARRIKVYDEDGREHAFLGIRFVKEA